ncbi:fibronectin type III domain-containing protein 11-like [Siniperca chuatsi]|uniref:fibronectin type III domain-containing protein 11-like n=1 Tax=Siniperca chuatsi TaxID=119488 RepID=UPI001CE13B2F|nr:fibronectin type III domain-containing protein 11-like [Siniperca chuatsi]XP_044069141.1 fibronectin type III domain-containing protein 11-like [Siniperca chuatsi]XP_044069150.1 fibronectin type III domain-containing protein 11-like [Siniperca chuatsi]
MDEVKLARTKSVECGAQEVKTQMDLFNQILQLLDTKLNDNSIMVFQEELRLMQRSSYYLEIQRDDLLPTADQQQHTLHLTDSTVWSLIDQQRLQRAMTLANTQVRLLLALLGMLYQGIIRGCRELEAFINRYDQGLVDSDTAASMQQMLQQTHQYMNDFESRMTRNLGPLDLQNQLIPNTGNLPIPQLSASLAIKMPVIFDRFKSCTTSNTVHLCWEVAGQQSKEPNQQFEIHVKSLHPTIAEHDQFTKSTCQSYNIQVNNLIPDRYYQFSVKRVDAVNLVYALWIDTIILKTLDIPM